MHSMAAGEFAENVWPADIELSADPAASAWQLAAITPVGALDQLRLLRSKSFAELLKQVATLAREAVF